MLLTPHTIVGVTLASIIPNPYIAVPLSFGLHFLGDLIPHWDYCFISKKGNLDKFYPLKVMADLSLGIGIGMFFTLHALFVIKDPTYALNIFLCGIFSVLPDAIVAPAIFNPEAKGLPKLMFKIQTFMHIQIPLPWGLISQLIVSASCLFLTLRLTGLL